MKVMVDGFNLSLAQGTGVATYARNLTYNLKALGHEVHVLYGIRGSPDRSAIMREISFYDRCRPKRQARTNSRTFSPSMAADFRPIQAAFLIRDSYFRVWSSIGNLHRGCLALTNCGTCQIFSSEHIGDSLFSSRAERKCGFAHSSHALDLSSARASEGCQEHLHSA